MIDLGGREGVIAVRVEDAELATEARVEDAELATEALFDNVIEEGGQRELG
jgi:hypothetical protein